MDVPYFWDPDDAGHPSPARNDSVMVQRPQHTNRREQPRLQTLSRPGYSRGVRLRQSSIASDDNRPRVTNLRYLGMNSDRSEVELALAPRSASLTLVDEFGDRDVLGSGQEHRPWPANVGELPDLEPAEPEQIIWFLNDLPEPERPASPGN